MSRLAFDDILKPGPSLGPGASRANARSRASDTQAAAERSLSFDNTFKQAVEELHPNETPTSDEELDSAGKNIESSSDPVEKNKAKQPATTQKDAHNKSDRTEPGNEKSSTAAEQSPELASKPNDSEDPDDVLIALVMAAALEQEKALAGEGEGEVLNTAALEEATNSTGNLTDNLTAETLATTSTETTDSAEQDTLQQDPNQLALVAASEVVVPQNMGTGSEAAQATQAMVSTTAEVDADVTQTESTTADATKIAATQGTSATAEASQESSDQQDSMDMDQDAKPKEGETATVENSQAAAANGSSSQSEEQTIEVTDKKQNTPDPAVKVEAPLERPAATMAPEARSNQGTSTTPTQQSAGPTLDTTDRVRFVERVAQAFNAQSSENSTIRMRLHPEELGSIKLEMTVRDGTMHARIETETREARNVLLDNLPALRERLATHNIKVEQFDIDYNAGGGQGSPGSPDDWRDPGQNGSNRSTHRTTTTTEEADTLEVPAPRAASRAGSGKQLDVTV